MKTVIGSVLGLFVSTVGAKTFDVSSHGAAAGDGVHKDTSAIQRAMDAAEEGGVGTVELSAETYLSGSHYLKDNVELVLRPGAVLKASSDKADYNRARRSE